MPTVTSVHSTGQQLAEAFATFANAAGSLERSYGQLQSEIVRLRRELERKNSDLEAERESARRLQALAEISTVLAHEIRNPLASLELFSGLLADAGELSAESRGWVDQLRAGLRTLSATVNNVLRLHSPASPERTSVQVSTLLRDAAAFVAPLGHQYGVSISLEENDSQLLVAADPHALRQLFLNLAINAFQAMKNGGALTIRTHIEQSRRKAVGIEFADNGTGISPENLEKIFSAGFTTKREGTGLGLAVCRQIVAQHGGSIEAASTLGRGTTIKVTLPVEGELQ